MRVVAASGEGAAVAWVRNTVDDAIDAAALLRGRGIDAMLFHARFAMVDRLRIEEEVLRRFGREPKPCRAGVLVATQVIEQSLDLDFDLLCTDLAPADLLIQRAGRLWRHQRSSRPVAGPELLVISPEAVAEPGPDWLRSTLPGTAAVYRDPALMWRGARKVFGRGAIITPDRTCAPLIEDAAAGEEPPGLARAAAQAEGAEDGPTGHRRTEHPQHLEGLSLVRGPLGHGTAHAHSAGGPTAGDLAPIDCAGRQGCPLCRRPRSETCMGAVGGQDSAAPGHAVSRTHRSRGSGHGRARAMGPLGTRRRRRSNAQ